MNHQFFAKIGNKVGQSAKQQAIAFAKSGGKQLGIETPQERAIKNQQAEQVSLANLFFTQSQEKNVMLSQQQEDEIKKLDISKAQRIEEELRQLRMQRQKEMEEWKKQQEQMMQEPGKNQETPVMLPTSPKKGPQGPGRKPQKAQPLIVTQKQNKAETGRQTSG